MLVLGALDHSYGLFNAFYKGIYIQNLLGPNWDLSILGLARLPNFGPPPYLPHMAKLSK